MTIEFVRLAPGLNPVALRDPGALNAALTHDAAQAHHELVAAPGAGKRLVIDRIGASNQLAAGTVQFEYDTAGTQTAIGMEHGLAIYGGAAYAVKWRLPENKNFGFTSAGGIGRHSVDCDYHEEAV